MNTLMHAGIYTLVCSCNTMWCSHVAVSWFWKRQMWVCCFVIVFRVVEHLLRHGADPALRDHAGYTATHYAALNGHRLTLEMVFTISISIGAMGWTSVTISHSQFSRTAYTVLQTGMWQRHLKSASVGLRFCISSLSDLNLDVDL